MNTIQILFVIASVVLVNRVAAHARLMKPVPRSAGYFPESSCGGKNNYPDGQNVGTCMWALFPDNYWFNQGCQIGCPECTGSFAPQVCANPIPPMLNGSLRTYPNVEYPLRHQTIEVFPYNPWRAPGHAPVIDPCGIVGGFNFTNTSLYVFGNLGIPPKGAGGLRGSSLPPTTPTVWKAGEAAEVIWSAPHANHGGGYQYRLCPADRELTEECFQQRPLDPIGDTSWIQFGPTSSFGPNKRVPFKATRVSKAATGTDVKPAGSTWTKAPIPPCKGTSGGVAGSCNTDQGDGQPMFEPPVPGLYGFGMTACPVNQGGKGSNGCPPEVYSQLLRHYDFSIVDKLHVPSDLHGRYVLSWRWDSEQTPQIWANCADITIL